jgi:hypothetical protein
MLPEKKFFEFISRKGAETQFLKNHGMIFLNALGLIN